MKLAKILPIYKSDDEQLVNNYRPISILQFFSKIFEKIISKYIIEFMDVNKLFYGNQFECQKQHSTCHAIITLVEKVSKAFRHWKNCCWCIFRSKIKKAFDTVDHTILLRKLQSYGIRGNVHA